MDARANPSRNVAPTQAEWDALSDQERLRVVEALSASMAESEAAPPEGDAHFTAKVSAFDTLRGYFGRRGRSAYVASELTVYYPGARRFAPDLLVVFDVDPKPRTKWVVSAEGRGLDFVLEIHCGGDRKKDAEENVRFYASLGIPEYFVFDRTRARLHGYRLAGADARTYVPIIPQAGRYESDVLDLSLEIDDGRLRFRVANALLLETAEWAGHLEQRLNEEVQRLDLAAREIEEANRRADEAERLRAEEARLRAEESALRVAAEARVAALQAELDRLKR